MLRLLATRHCFREVDKGVFSNNRLSAHITSRSPISGWIDFLTSYSATGALNLCPALTDPDYALSRDANKSTFMYAIKDKGFSENVYDNLEPDSEKSDIIYPWDKYESICDVGSGVGSFGWGLLSSFPCATVTLHDLPETISLAENVWKADHYEHITAGRVNFAAGNFLESVPAKNCDVYYVRVLSTLTCRLVNHVFTGISAYYHGNTVEEYHSQLWVYAA
ncbi:hypothetical protein CPC08DRAFT_725188 [Agrocybe pediades]|nr:hypothetical protein CPC08DRAFT_725188 [Agrocybe pediades]